MQVKGWNWWLKTRTGSVFFIFACVSSYILSSGRVDALYKLEKATVADVVHELPGKRNHSTVRAQLQVLEEKHHVRHETRRLKYVYRPMVSGEVARRSTLRRVIEIFFDGSTENLLAALMAEKDKA